MSLLLVALGAAVGAPLRYLTDRAISARHDSVFPWGTFVVNVLGSLLLGLASVAVSPNTLLLLGTGFCGALTTYSTFSYETLRLVEDGSGAMALANVAASVLTAVAAAAAGVAIAHAV